VMSRKVWEMRNQLGFVTIKSFFMEESECFKGNWNGSDTNVQKSCALCHCPNLF
jgi:hypothetical protein